MNAEQMARNKLQSIIQREGDANGERLKPYYLAALLAEIERDLAVTAYTIENHNVAPAARRQNT